MTAPTDFLIAAQATGTNPDNWSVVSTLLTITGGVTPSRVLDWEFESYSKYDMLANGKKKGLGFAVARWTFKALRPEQRENLRDFCSALSADVYIRTRTNETTAGAATWDDFSAIMHWKDGAEVFGVNSAEMVEITFTHLVAI